MHIHHWQQHNPVLTEALIQLTLGAPPPVYNGGLLHAPLRYLDPLRRRPGLPEDVAALVTRVASAEIDVHLVNLSPTNLRELVVQSGAFAEHRFDDVRYDALCEGSHYPGRPAYAPPAPAVEARRASVGGQHLLVRLPPNTEIRLTLSTSRLLNDPTYDD